MFYLLAINLQTPIPPASNFKFIHKYKIKPVIDKKNLYSVRITPDVADELIAEDNTILFSKNVNDRDVFTGMYDFRFQK